MSKIDILMATYNGESYVASQIRSLQSQTFKDWTLWVHDDGSTDSTLAVIASLARTDERIRIVDDGKRFHNCALNFMHLLQSSEAPYCIFCDQDDIWLENKLQLMYEAIDAQDNSRPQVVYSNAFVYNPDQPSIEGFATLCHPQTLHDVLFMNGGIQGCALMFNAQMRNICRQVPAVVAMHDHVLTLAAVTFGHLSYVDRRLMLYRRHEKTVTENQAKRLTDRIRPFFQSKKTVVDAHHYEAIKSFVAQYASWISDEQKVIFDDFFRFEKEDRLKRAWHVWRRGYNLYGHRSILSFKMLVRRFL